MTATARAGQKARGAGAALRRSRTIVVMTTAAWAACAPAARSLAPSDMPTSAAAPGAGEMQVIDDFEELTAWETAPASGVELRIAEGEGRDGGGAMRVDFDFHGGGGWAAVRRDVAVTLPDNYELSFWLRGEAPSNTLEVKLIDDTGENVWWINRREFEFEGGWRKVTFRKRHVEFAWGPAGGGEIRQVAALELTITAGNGGQGTVWYDDLTLTPREPVLAYDLEPSVTASSSASGSDPAHVLDGDTTSAWRSARGGAQTVTLDFLRNREYGGVVVAWEPGRRAIDYDVQLSHDGSSWQTVREVRGGRGARDYLHLPESESRWLRLSMRSASEGYAIRELDVRPIEWGASRNALFETIAADARRGAYPKYLLREQSYWTVVGVSGDEKEALVNEEGMVEVDLRSFSIEPFLFTEGSLVTWADSRNSQSLENGSLPVPSVRREGGSLALTVTAWADGERDASMLWLRYRVHNAASTPRTPTLYLALRPFQVNPSWQFLNNPGGAAGVESIAYDGREVVVNESRRVVPVTRPGDFGAARFDEGGVIEWLGSGTLPQADAIVDAFGHASAALSYPLELRAGETRDVYLAVPFHDATPAVTANHPDPAAVAEPRLASTVDRWRRELDRFSIELPAGAPDLDEIVKSNVAYVLINRDGAAIQPGSRAYERSWIRDGSLTSAALLRVGHADAVREFIEWYAPFQYADGKVPCCVDRRGAGPVPENDSHGQLIYLIAEYHRFTGDRAFLERLWPHVEAAVAYIDSLRHARMTPEYRTPEKRAFYGLVPESISHEGYSAKPMHSYWDDFFALKGLADAVYIADALGRDDARTRFAASRDEFEANLVASFENAMRMHHIDFLPGSVELGDFDATSTTVGVTPAGARTVLPDSALERTFARYWREAEARMQGRAWEAYTPYELRTVGTFVRLGDRQRAHALLDWFLGHRRPAAWNHWAEVVFREPAAPRFIGDMPHTWVGSDFIRSATDMFVYERHSDGALVIGAGILPAWLDGDGVRVRGLRTPRGTVAYTMRRDGDAVVLSFDGSELDLSVQLVVPSPVERPLRSIVVDGSTRAVSSQVARLDGAPRRLILQY